MEVVGGVASVITIVALFKNCLDTFDFIQAGKDMVAESFKLILRLQLEKSRLWAWGDAMGLTVDLQPGQHHALESHSTRNLVALKTILTLFTDADQLQNKYGCRQNSSGLVGTNSQFVLPSDSASTLLALSLSFDDFRVPLEKKGLSRGLILRTRWVLRDEAKSCELIDEIKSFIDPLKDLTASISSVAAQDRIVTQRVQRIDKPEALDLISEVCEIDYPQISSAASRKLNAVTMATDRVREIAEWADCVDDETDKGLQDILSLDLLELGKRLKGWKRISDELYAQSLSRLPATWIKSELTAQLSLRVWGPKQVGSPTKRSRVVPCGGNSDVHPHDTLNNSHDLYPTFRAEVEATSNKIKRLEKENLRLTRENDQLIRINLEMAEERTHAKLRVGKVTQERDANAS